MRYICPITGVKIINKKWRRRVAAAADSMCLYKKQQKNARAPILQGKKMRQKSRHHKIVIKDGLMHPLRRDFALEGKTGLTAQPV